MAVRKAEYKIEVSVDGSESLGNLAKDVSKLNKNKINMNVSGIEDLSSAKAGVGSLAKGFVIAQLAMQAAEKALKYFMSQFNDAVSVAHTMNLVNINMDNTRKTTLDLTDAVIDLQKEFGGSSVEQAVALQKTLQQAFYNTAESAHIARQANILTDASGLELNNSIDFLTSTMKTYGMEAANAAHVTDILLVASTNAGGGIDKIAAAISDIAPVAKELGISYQDVALSIATMVRNGSTAEDAVGGLKAAFNTLLNPQEDVANGMDEITRKSALTAISQKGFVKALRDVSDSMGGGGEAILKSFGRIEKGAAITKLITGDISKSYEKMAKEIEDSMNSIGSITEKRADQANKSIDELMQSISGKIGAQASRAWKSLLESMRPVFEFLDNNINKFSLSRFLSNFIPFLDVFDDIRAVINDVVIPSFNLLETKATLVFLNITLAFKKFISNFKDVQGIDELQKKIEETSIRSTEFYNKITSKNFSVNKQVFSEMNDQASVINKIDPKKISNMLKEGSKSSKELKTNIKDLITKFNELIGKLKQLRFEVAKNKMSQSDYTSFVFSSAMKEVAATEKQLKSSGQLNKERRSQLEEYKKLLKEQYDFELSAAKQNELEKAKDVEIQVAKAMNNELSEIKLSAEKQLLIYKDMLKNKQISNEQYAILSNKLIEDANKSINDIIYNLEVQAQEKIYNERKRALELDRNNKIIDEYQYLQKIHALELEALQNLNNKKLKLEKDFLEGKSGLIRDMMDKSRKDDPLRKEIENLNILKEKEILEIKKKLDPLDKKMKPLQDATKKYYKVGGWWDKKVAPKILDKNLISPGSEGQELVKEIDRQKRPLAKKMESINTQREPLLSKMSEIEEKYLTETQSLRERINKNRLDEEINIYDKTYKVIGEMESNLAREKQELERQYQDNIDALRQENIDKYINNFGTALEKLESEHYAKLKDIASMLNKPKQLGGISKEKAKEITKKEQQSTAFKTPVAKMTDAVEPVSSLVSGFSGMIEGMAGIVGNIVTALAKIPQIFENLIDLVDKAMQSWLDLPTKIFDKFMASAEKTFSFLGDFIGTLGKRLPYISSALTKSIIVAIPKIISGVINAIPLLIMGFIKAIPEVANAFISALWEALKSLKDSFLNILKPETWDFSKLTESGTKAVDAVKKSVTGVGEQLFGYVEASGAQQAQVNAKAITEASKQGAGAFDKTFAKLGASIMKVIEKLMPVINVIVGYVTMIVEIYATISEVIINHIVETFNFIAETIGTAADLMGNEIQFIIDSFMAVVNSVKAVFISLWDSLKWLFVDVIYGTIIEPFINTIKAFKEFFTNVWDKPGEAFAKLGADFSAIWDKLKEKIGAVFVNGAAIFGKLVDSLSNVFDEWLKNVKAYFAGFGKIIGDAFSDIGKYFKNIGEDIWDGIKGAWGSVKEFFSDLFKIEPSPGDVENWMRLDFPWVTFAEGGFVGGTAKVAGDSLANDTVPALLSAGEYVLPRSVTQDKDLMKLIAALINSGKKVEMKAGGDNFWSDTWNKAKSVGSSVVDTVSSAGSAVWEGAKDVGKAVVQGASWVGDLLVPDWIQGVYDSMSRFFSNLSLTELVKDPLPYATKVLKDGLSVFFKDPLLGGLKGGIKSMIGFANGGLVPQGTDTVPAMLTPGEYVLNRDAVSGLGAGFLDRLNSGNMGGSQGVTNQNIEVTLNIKTEQPIDERYIKQTLMPTIKDELRRMSLDGRRVLSTSGVR